MVNRFLIALSIILGFAIQGCGDLPKDPCDTVGVACHNKCYFVKKHS